MEINEESLQQKFNELLDLYRGFVNKPNRSSNDMANFINSAFNCLNVMNKIISLAYTVKSEQQIAAENLAEDTKNLKEGLESAKEVIEQEIKKDDDKKQKRDDFIKDINNILNKSEDISLQEEKKKLLFNISYMEQLAAIDREKKNKILEENPELKEILKNKEELTDEEKQERVDEYDKVLEKYANASEKEIIRDEMLSWKAKPKWAGFKNLMNLGKAIELSDNTLNKDSDAEDLFYYLAKANGIGKAQLEKNLDNIANKCDFSKPLFCTLLRQITVDCKKKISGELLIRELIDFYE